MILRNMTFKITVVNLLFFAHLGESDLRALADAINISAEFNARGQILRQSLPYRSGETVHWTEYRHDSLDRQITVIHPEGSTLSTNYILGDDFQAVETIDELGQKRVTHFDDFGNEIYRDRYDGAVLMRTEFDYDILKRLTGITDPLGSVWSYSYDGHGNLISVSDPDLGCRQMTFDAANRVIEQRSADGTLTSYSYDALGRVLTKTVDKGALQFPDCTAVNP